MWQVIITSFPDRLFEFDLTWRNKKDVSSFSPHGDILRDNHSMFENPTHVLMPCQARVQIHVVWHLKWTRLVDYQVLFSDDKHVDLCVVSYLPCLEWCEFSWTLSYTTTSHTYAPFATKVRQSHLVRKIGTSPNSRALGSGLGGDDSHSFKGVMVKKWTK